jgi:hypothetical protein
VQRLEPAQLATVLAHVPIEHAIEILHTVVPATAAGALSAAHSSLGTRLMHALPHRSAASSRCSTCSWAKSSSAVSERVYTAC